MSVKKNCLNLNVSFVFLLSLFLNSLAYGDVVYYKYNNLIYRYFGPNYRNVPQASIPSSIQWKWENVFFSGGVSSYYQWVEVARVPEEPEAKVPAQVDGQIEAICKKVEEERQRELALQAEIARQNEMKQQMEGGSLAMRTAELNGLQQVADLYADMHYEQIENDAARAELVDKSKDTASELKEWANELTKSLVAKLNGGTAGIAGLSNALDGRQEIIDKVEKEYGAIAAQRVYEQQFREALVTDVTAAAINGADFESKMLPTIGTRLIGAAPDSVEKDVFRENLRRYKLQKRIGKWLETIGAQPNHDGASVGNDDS